MDTLQKLINLLQATDNVAEQKWWTLEVSGRPSAWRTTAEEEILTQQRGLWAGLEPLGTADVPRDERIARITRTWAELATWYPALAPAAGASPVASLATPAHTLPGVNLRGFPAQGRNVDLTSIGGELGLVGGDLVSHSYLTVKAPAEVWRGYRVIRDLFRVQE